MNALDDQQKIELKPIRALTHSKMSRTNAIPSAGGCRVIIRNKFLDRLLRESYLKLNSLKNVKNFTKRKQEDDMCNGWKRVLVMD